MGKSRHVTWPSRYSVFIPVGKPSFPMCDELCTRKSLTLYPPGTENGPPSTFVERTVSAANSNSAEGLSPKPLRSSFFRFVKSVIYVLLFGTQPLTWSVDLFRKC